MQNKKKMSFKLIKYWSLLFVIHTQILKAQTPNYDSLVLQWQQSCLNALSKMIDYNEKANDAQRVSLLREEKEVFSKLDNCKNNLTIESCQIIDRSLNSLFLLRTISGEQAGVEIYILTFNSNGSYYLYSSVNNSPYLKKDVTKVKFEIIDDLFCSCYNDVCNSYVDNKLIISRFSNNNTLVASKIMFVICSSLLKNIIQALKEP